MRLYFSIRFTLVSWQEEEKQNWLLLVENDIFRQTLFVRFSNIRMYIFINYSLFPDFTDFESSVQLHLDYSEKDLLRVNFKHILSFLSLKRIETYLRNTTGHDCFSGLACIGVSRATEPLSWTKKKIESFRSLPPSTKKTNWKFAAAATEKDIALHLYLHYWILNVNFKLIMMKS